MLIKTLVCNIYNSFYTLFLFFFPWFSLCQNEGFVVGDLIEWQEWTMIFLVLLNAEQVL